MYEKGCSTKEIFIDFINQAFGKPVLIVAINKEQFDASKEI